MPNWKVTAGMIAAMTVPFASVSGQSNTRIDVRVRELSSPDAKSATPFASILTIHGLHHGKVLLNDPKGRRLVVLDSTLRISTVVMDSTATDGRGYGRGYRPVFPFTGDSVMVVDGGSYSLILINPDGSMGRTLALPFADHVSDVSVSSGVRADANGDLVYRVLAPIMSRAAAVATKDTAIVRRSTRIADSALVVRASFSNRSFEKIGAIKQQSEGLITTTLTMDGIVQDVVVDPLQRIDEFAVLSDGTVAFVRGHDYHVDILGANGQLTRGPKLPFDWMRVSESEKQRLVDSTARTIEESEKELAKMRALMQNGGRPSQSERAGRDGSRNSSETVPTTITSRYKAMSVEQLSDYYPPLRRGAVKSDMDANLWILPATSAQSKSGELIYDVVNNRGELSHRVRVPAGRSIGGFGKGGIVYLISRDDAGWWLERTRILPQ